MPRITVTADDGSVTFTERVTGADFASDHFRRCLAERLAWATEDAEHRPPQAEARPHEGEHRVRRGHWQRKPRTATLGGASAVSGQGGRAPE